MMWIARQGGKGGKGMVRRLVDGGMCCNPSFQRGRKGRDERRQILLDRLPENIQVDIEIGMDEPIPHPDDILPGNLG